jgi:non-ribosomal peptide synthetase-like protein
MFMSGSFLQIWFYRALGMTIGQFTHIHTFHLDAFDLISIGDHTSIGLDVQLQTIRVQQGYVIVGRIDIGDRCYIGARSAINGGLQQATRIENEGQLAELSLLPAASVIGPNEAFAGAPATRVALCPRVDLERLVAGQPSLIRQLLFIVGQATSFVLLPLVIFGAGAPSALFLYFFQTQIEDSIGSIGLWLVFPVPAAALFLFIVAMLICGLKWLLIGKFTHHVVWMYSWRYLCKWSIDNLMELSLHLLHAAYASLYLPSWFRLLGAKLGDGVEISTAAHVTPDFLELGEGGKSLSSFLSVP